MQRDSTNSNRYKRNSAYTALREVLRLMRFSDHSRVASLLGYYTVPSELRRKQNDMTSLLGGLKSVKETMENVLKNLFMTPSNSLVARNLFNSILLVTEASFSLSTREDSNRSNVGGDTVVGPRRNMRRDQAASCRTPLGDARSQTVSQ